MIAVFLTIAILLLLLNAFFVLAEFAAVKIRPSRIEELIDKGSRQAVAAKHVHDHLDEYLSVCQVGITLASIGLGFVAEPAFVRLIEPLVSLSGWFEQGGQAAWLTSHGIAFGISYILVSYLHIVVGELVPKSMAIRRAESAALHTAVPLRLFRTVFFVPLSILNGSANAILWLIGLGGSGHHQPHSEVELRFLLDQSQSSGLMSFRRLLYMENVFDLGELRVRDAMRPRAQVRCLQADRSWDENLQTIREYRFTRYPLVIDQSLKPAGIVHLKDLLLMVAAGEPDLKALVRPLITISENAMLETLLATMQRRRIHAALVTDSQKKWTGFLTLEDVIEEIIGTIRDEFEDEEQFSLSEAVQIDRIFLGIDADDPISAVRQALNQMPPEKLPMPSDLILKAVEERERTVGTYLGRQIGMPHARLAGLKRPFAMIIRSDRGIPYPNTTERAHLLFVLLTPAGQPRVHQRLQVVIATILDESMYVPERLRTAKSSAEVLEIVRAAEQATID